MKKLILSFMLFTLITSCKKDSSEIDQSKIFQNYSMIYNEETNKTTVSAYFYEEKFEGKELELTGSSNITMNGDAMTKNGTQYSTSIDGVLDTATLVFTDNDGKKFTNKILKVKYIANEPTTELENGISSYWYWLGEQIATDETVTLIFSNVADQLKNAKFTENTVDRSYLTLAASTLSTLPTGGTKVEISRYKTTKNGDFSPVGGMIGSTYKGLSNIITIY